MPLHSLRLCLCLLLLSACAPRSMAAGVLMGVVSRADTKDPVASVRVTATSPSLPHAQFVLTDEAGQYRLAQLPPGTYVLRFEESAGQGHTREGLLLRSDRTMRVNTELPLAQAEAVLFSTAATGVGVNVGADFVRNIAVVRSCEAGESCSGRRFEGLDGCLPPTPPGQGSRLPSWAHPYAPLVRPTGEPQLVHCNG